MRPPVPVPAEGHAVPIGDLAVHAVDIPVDGPDGQEQYRVYGGAENDS